MALGYLAQVVFFRIAPQTRSVCLRFEWPHQKVFVISLLVLEVDPGPGFVEVEAHRALVRCNMREVNAERAFGAGQFTPLHRHPGQILVFVLPA
jgi:hypothetical protein